LNALTGAQFLPDSLASNATRPHPSAPAATARSFIAAQPRSRTILLSSAVAAALLVCGLHAAVASADTVPASGIGYLCDSLILFGCSAALWTRVRSASGPMRVRWYIFSAALLCESIGFVPSFTECFLHTGPARQLQTACFNAGEVLFVLAAVVFFAGVARSVVVMDLLQALVFLVLRFNLAWSPITRDHFTNIHLIVGQSVAVVLFLVALVACLGAASRAELTFLRTLSWFFGLRLIAFFTADQVSYIWLHHIHCSLWDVVGDVLFAGFALHLLWTAESDQNEQAEVVARHAPGVMVRSLMPSFLALLNLMLGLFLMRISLRLAAVAIAVTVVSYVLRAALLHAQAVEERAHLESRNLHLEGLAIRDPLTGIGNRRSLASAYAGLQQTAPATPLSLLLLDIDSFKRANDCHGHQHGDHVLVTLARKLENVAAGVAGSHCARLGGDEFALLLPAVTPEEAFSLAEAVRALIGAHRFAVEGKVSVSVGLASLEAARDLPLETLVCHADEALYRAKRQGRNRVETQPVWNPAMPNAFASHFPLSELEETLR
jgi:diguanylate cyclase (GGDEF)-like protein